MHSTIELLDLVTSRKQPMVYYALNQLSGKCDESVIPALVQAFSRGNMKVRHKAAQLLAEIGREQELSQLIAYLNSHDPDMKTYAVLAIAKRDEPSGRDAICNVQIVKSSYENFILAAAIALGWSWYHDFRHILAAIFSRYNSEGSIIGFEALRSAALFHSVEGYGDNFWISIDRIGRDGDLTIEMIEEMIVAEGENLVDSLFDLLFQTVGYYTPCQHLTKFLLRRWASLIGEPFARKVAGEVDRVLNDFGNFVEFFYIYRMINKSNYQIFANLIPHVKEYAKKTLADPKASQRVKRYATSGYEDLIKNCIK